MSSAGGTFNARASFVTVTGYAPRIPFSRRYTVPAETPANLPSSRWLSPRPRRSCLNAGSGMPLLVHPSRSSSRRASLKAVLLVSRARCINELPNGAEAAPLIIDSYAYVRLPFAAAGLRLPFALVPAQ